MRSRRGWVAVAVAAAVLIPFACSDDDSSSDDEEPPATVVELGDGAKQVTLTEAAARRLGIEMGEITEEGGDMVIPYAAVVYDEEGATWTYLSPEPLTFVRTSITVARIADDDKAFLSDGPDVGTEVVTVGQAELFGVEKGIGY